MIYKNTADKTLSEKLFKQPTSEYRGAPFWAWNTALNDDMLLRQIDVFKQMGMGGFHTHVRTGMATKYLGDEYFHFIKLCNEKAKRENMLCWLYDEDRWPSGAAGGYVTVDRKYRKRFIQFSCNDIPDKSLFAQSAQEFNSRSAAGEKLNGYLIGRYELSLDGEGYLADYRRLAPDEECGGKIWYARVHVDSDGAWFNGQAYLDAMNPAAVDRFIDITHEAYYREVGEDFGGSIPAIFTDEPQIHMRGYLNRSTLDEGCINLAYTDDFDDTFRAAYGAGLLERLPELLFNTRDGRSALTRWRYMDHMCERFVSAFADNIGKWCENHGIALTGHVMNEGTLYSQSGSLGEAMRCYRGFTIPGIDMLCDYTEFSTAKQTQSCVHQYGREGMMSELYGVTDWHFPFAGHKRAGDWQAALGVTLRVHHLTWVSMNGSAKRDYPASIGYQSPWYGEYKYIEDHFARLNTVLTRGKPLVRVAMIHPVESYWLYGGPSDKDSAKRAVLDERFIELTRRMCCSGVDFDFISESLLPELCKSAQNPLRVGEMEYDCVIVPLLDTIRSTTLERLSDFSSLGGTVILMGEAPSCVDAVPSDRAQSAAREWVHTEYEGDGLLNALAPFRMLDFTDMNTGKRCDNFVHQFRDDGEYKWLFICHGTRMNDRKGFDCAYDNEKVMFSLSGEYELTEYNTLTGDIYTPAYTVRDGKTFFERTVYAEDSILMRLSPSRGQRTVAGNLPGRAVPHGIGKTLNGAYGYTLCEDNVLLLDRAEYSFDGEPYHESMDSIFIADEGRARFYKGHEGQREVQPWVPMPPELANDSGHRVKRKFSFESEIPLRGARLALEQADESIIYVNGARVSAEPQGYFTDECIRCVALPDIGAGHVEIEIETPFFLRSCTEWCYLLGDFGMKISGKSAVTVERSTTVTAGSLTEQTMPFYAGNITYHIDYEETDGAQRTLSLPSIGGACARVCIDGKDCGLVAISPFCCDLGYVERGGHVIEITVYGTRSNSFGQIHNVRHSDENLREFWWSPGSWQRNADYSEDYHLRRTGLLTPPVIY